MQHPDDIRVAFADDHSMVRQAIVSMLLDTGGVKVDIQAKDGQDLINQLERAVTLPHICIVDINMPVMDGFDTVLEIGKRWPGMKTLVLTTYDFELYIIRIMQAGANGYLLKSSSIEDVKTALVSIQTSGYYYSECANSALFHLVRTKAIKLQPFTENEIDLLKYCCTELSFTEIAKKMNTSYRSVEGYRDRLFAKLNVNSRIGLALFAIQFGFVTIPSNYTRETILPIQKENSYEKEHFDYPILPNTSRLQKSRKSAYT